MKKLIFEKHGLSPEKVEQLRAYKILPDKQILKNLTKAHEADKAEETEIADSRKGLSQPIDEGYIHFLLEHNGDIPSKNRVKGSKVVIDRLLTFQSAYKFHSLMGLYIDFQKQGISIACTPADDTLLLAENQQIYLFNYNIQDIEPSPIATSFADLLMKLYQLAMIDYTPKEHGWATVTISNDTAEIVFVASHLRDNRQDLIRSVTTLERYKEAIVVFQDEPDGYVFRLERDNKHCYYILHSFKNYDPTALCELVLEGNTSLASYENDIAKIE